MTASLSSTNGIANTDSEETKQCLDTSHQCFPNACNGRQDSKINPESSVAVQFEDIDDELIIELHDIQNEFHIVFTEVFDHLERQGVTVKRFVTFLKRVDGYIRKPLYDDEIISKLFQASDLVEVCDTIEKYCSWFNHSLLGVIVDKFCKDNQTIKKRHQEYCSHLKKYCEHCVRKCPFKLNGFGHRGKKDKVMVVIMDRKFDEIRTEQLEEAVLNLARIMNVSRHALRLCSVKKGSV